MREIKFRAFYNGKWYEPVFVGGTQVPLVFSSSGELVNLCAHIEEYFVCQYTGLLSKSGVEIFEGDIMLLEYISGEQRHLIVKYKYGSFSAYGKNEASYSLTFSGNAVKRFEVIGNIYENPELLGKEKHENQT